MTPPLELHHASPRNGDPARPDSQPMPMIRRLRQLQPQRPLTIDEAISIAERQAYRLLQVLGITRAPIPEEAITGLSRVAIRRDPQLPSVGFVHWHHDTWLIHINSQDHPYQQRLTIAHEFKHIIDRLDQPTAAYLAHQDRPLHHLEERFADYFARCVYLPKPLLLRYYTAGIQDPTTLAEHFEVPEPIVRLRLRELGLIDHEPPQPANRTRLWKRRDRLSVSDICAFHFEDSARQWRSAPITNRERR
ncbi:MAG: ImmA/IrrE family metallo-endopeptidase [Ilumatobacteraceae bacterium]